MQRSKAMDVTTIIHAVTILQQQGISVSVRQVHRLTGGSFRDISRLLQALRSVLPTEQPPQEQVEAGPAVPLSTRPHNRGMEIMRLWPTGFHTGPSLSPRIGWTTETDGHAYSMRPQTPSSVPPDVACRHNRRSATASAAQSRTTARLDAS